MSGDKLVCGGIDALAKVIGCDFAPVQIDGYLSAENNPLAAVELFEGFSGFIPR